MDVTISIWLASDSNRFRRSLDACVDRHPQFAILGQCSADDSTLAARLRERRPDMLLVDWPEPARHGHGVSTLKRLAAFASHVLVLVPAPTMAVVAGILTNRLHGYLRIDSTPEECSRAMTCVLKGEVWIPRSRLAASLAELLLERDARVAADLSASQASPGPFTTREREIVLLVRQGMTNKQIGHELGIEEDTVKKHLQHIYNKVGVHRRSLLALGSGTGTA